MSKHTPGPWLVQYPMQLGPIKITAVGKRQPIALLFTRPYKPDEEKANARLIATAPELLEALEFLLEMLEDYAGTNQENDSVEMAEKAIAKAKGE